MPITEREKEAHDKKPAIAVVEDEDVNLGNVILERFGGNDERGVIVTLIREIHRGRGRTMNLLRENQEKLNTQGGNIPRGCGITITSSFTDDTVWMNH